MTAKAQELAERIETHVDSMIALSGLSRDEYADVAISLGKIARKKIGCAMSHFEKPSAASAASA